MSIKGIDKQHIKDYAFINKDFIDTNIQRDNNLSAEERQILADVLWYDKSYAIPNKSDPYYQGVSNTNTNLAVQLQYVSDDDIVKYINNHLGLSGEGTTETLIKIRGVFDEARELSTHSFTDPFLQSITIKNIVTSIEKNLDAANPNDDVTNSLIQAFQEAIKKFASQDDVMPQQKLTLDDLIGFATTYHITDTLKGNLDWIKAVFIIDPKNGIATPRKFT